MSSEKHWERAGNLVLISSGNVGVFNTWEQAELCVKAVNNHHRLVDCLANILQSADGNYEAMLEAALKDGDALLSELKGDE